MSEGLSRHHKHYLQYYSLLVRFNFPVLDLALRSHTRSSALPLSCDCCGRDAVEDVI